MQAPPTPEHDLAAVEQALAVRRLHREMRVPLNTILGQVQMLQTAPRDDLSVEARARAIETAGLRLLDMLDGLLAAGAPLEGEHAQLRPVMLAQLIDQHAPGELSYRHGGDHSEAVWADPGVLLRMLGVLGGLITTGGAPWGRAELSWQADGDDLIAGGAGSDSLDGGDGVDRLDGGEGADILNGGVGDDVLVYDPNDLSVIGGSGTDTVLVSGAAETNVDTGPAFSGIEIVTMGGNVTTVRPPTAIVAARARGVRRMEGS